MAVDQIYCGDHFAIYINFKTLCYIPKTDSVIWKLHLNFLMKKKQDPKGSNSF